MTRRQTLARHRQSLEEIRDIMNSMKTLAYMEKRKLTALMGAQQQVVASIEAVAADFLGFFANTLPQAASGPVLYLLFGSERGFCGDYNQALLRHLQGGIDIRPDSRSLILAVGRKLHGLLDSDPRVAALVPGASVAEEIPAVLSQVVQSLNALQRQHGGLTLYGVHHGDNEEILTPALLPPFADCKPPTPPFAHPPLLQLPPHQFLQELSEQYLFAALHAMLYRALLAENHKRYCHLDGAVQHLNDESRDLARQSNALRQEEIIEEIEVILLSASSLQQEEHD